jgi:hypothetical protein
VEQEPLRRRDVGGGDVPRPRDAPEPGLDGLIDEVAELRFLLGVAMRDRLLQILCGDERLVWQRVVRVAARLDDAGRLSRARKVSAARAAGLR